MTSSERRGFTSAARVACAIVLSACHVEHARGSEGLDSAALPEEVREDYALFAQRCSKCHSLARPLQSGITDDEYWRSYVERMRRQPGSGIAPDEVPHILQFLHYYASSIAARTRRPSTSSAPPATEASAVAPAASAPMRSEQATELARPDAAPDAS
jgi:hypothetical protein